MQPADFLIDHASMVATCAGPAPRCGDAQADISPLAGATIAAHQGVIVYVGPAADLAASVRVLPGATRVNATGCTVTPGFVDPHTHIVYAGNRRGELQRRLAGASYESIAADGGGILSTVNATRAASDETLTAATRR